MSSPTSAPTDPELAALQRNIHLEDIISSLHSIKSDLGKLNVNCFVTSEFVSKMNDSVNSRLKSYAKDIAEFASSLDSKIRKSSLNQLQSQQLLSDKLDLMNTRFDAIDAKLATISATILTQSRPPSVVIDKNGEISKCPSKPTYDLARSVLNRTQAGKTRNKQIKYLSFSLLCLVLFLFSSCSSVDMLFISST